MHMYWSFFAIVGNGTITAPQRANTGSVFGNVHCGNVPTSKVCFSLKSEIKHFDSLEILAIGIVFALL